MEIQFFINSSSVGVNCTFDNCARVFALNVTSYWSEIIAIDERIFNSPKKISKWCCGDGKCKFVNIAEKRSATVKLFFHLSPKMRKKEFFFKNFAFFLKKIPRTREILLSQSCRNFSAKNSTHFLLQDWNSWKNCHSFQRKPIFLSIRRLYTTGSLFTAAPIIFRYESETFVAKARTFWEN